MIISADWLETEFDREDSIRGEEEGARTGLANDYSVRQKGARSDQNFDLI